MYLTGAWHRLLIEAAVTPRWLAAGTVGSKAADEMAAYGVVRVVDRDDDGFRAFDITEAGRLWWQHQTDPVQTLADYQARLERGV